MQSMRSSRFCGGDHAKTELQVRSGSWPLPDQALDPYGLLVSKLSSTGKPLAPAQIGRIFQRLGLSGKLLGSDQAWFAA